MKIDVYVYDEDDDESPASRDSFDSYEQAARFFAKEAVLYVTSMPPITVHKVRHKETGLFSRGGSYDRWSKEGKTWNKPAHLKNHLNFFKSWRTGLYEDRVDDWEVVIYSPTGVQILTVRDFHPEG